MGTRQLRWIEVMLAAVMLPALLAGCLLPHRRNDSPTSAGIHTNDLIDPAAQQTSSHPHHAAPAQLTTQIKSARSVLCLSGGGAYGAYSVGVLYGWSCRGDRPCFDVVTGISTGALIAPFAFLGSGYDNQLRELYTTMDKRDIYRLRPISGVFSESFASNRPLARKLNELVTPEMMVAIAREHAKGRRLYIGTTEMEGHRFIVWDLGAIASRGRPEDLELGKRILLASTALPGLFPPVRIPVTVHGQPFCELHVDGSVSQSVFFLPPAAPLSTMADGKQESPTNVYVIVAGKLYADAEEINPRALTIAIENLQAFGYAHTRGDVFRIWCTCQERRHGFQLTAIPPEYPAPRRMTEFDHEMMTQMFQEGYRQTTNGNAWRTTPPGQGPGEDTLIRSGSDLMIVPRSSGIVTSR